jgi:protein-tyrosine phosphatase
MNEPQSLNCKHKLCEIVPNLYVSSLQVARDKKLLKANGITHIVNASQCANAHDVDFAYLAIDIDGDEESDINRHFTRVSRFICTALVNRGKVLLHCAEGVSRSATFALAFFVQKRKMRSRDAFELVKKRRPCVCPNDGFRKQLSTRFRSPL